MLLRFRTGTALAALTAAVLVLAACSTGEPDPTESASSPPVQTSVPTAAPVGPSQGEAAGPPPGAYEVHESEGVRYLTSFGGGGGAAAHEVVASVGDDGCLYFETIGYTPNSTAAETETFLGVIGDPSFEVTAEGLVIDSVPVPFGTAFTASIMEFPPADQVPAGYAEQCAGAGELWSVGP